MNTTVENSEPYARNSRLRITSIKNRSRIAISVQENNLTPLVDGPEIFGKMAALFSKAKKYIYITSWSMRLKTPVGRKTLEDWLLQKAKENVKIRILWSDLDKKMSPFNERKAIQRLITKDKTNNIRIALSQLNDLGTTFAHIVQGIHGGTIGSHHQKTVVVDGKWAICSGADITTGAINRTYWHDVAVCIQGQGVLGIEENFVDRWNNEAPNDGIYEKLSINPKAKSSKICQTILTIPSWWWKNTDIRDQYVEVIDNAKNDIYIENQYLRHPLVGERLANSARKGVDISILIPKFPEEIDPRKTNMPIEAKIMHYSQYKVLKALSTGDIDWIDNPVKMIKRERIKKSAHLKNVKILSTAVKSKPYCHAKIMIVDGEISIIGSANLNKRSLDGVVDSECNVVINSKTFSSDLRSKLEKSKLRYRQVAHDINLDEKITRFDEYNFRERDRMTKKLSQSGLASYFFRELANEDDPDRLRELFATTFDFLI